VSGDDGHPFPLFLLAVHLGLGTGCTAAVVRWLAGGSDALDQYAVDAVWGVGLGVLAIVGLHEGGHAALYRWCGRRPYLGRAGVALVLGAREVVSRRLLLVQLRFVPRLATGLTVLLAAALGQVTGLARLPHALLLGAAAGATVTSSVGKDLHNCVFEVWPGASFFRDDGAGYRAVFGPVRASGRY